jgi:hypothetical protein
MWHVSTFDARNIEYGAIWFKWSGELDTLVPGELTAFSPYTPPFTCRVEPGDSVVWSGWCRVSSAEGTPQIILLLRWYNSAGTLLSITEGTATNLTITRTQYTLSQTAPPGSHYLRASFAFAGTGAEYTVTVVDSARLGVT